MDLTEIDLTMHPTIRESLRYAKLIGPSDDQEELEKYSNELLHLWIKEQLQTKIMAETIQFSLLGKRFAIKKGLVIMKLSYFTYNFGAALLFPFIPLQMIDLGLTIEDIGYIYGLYPLITMFSGPISGQAFDQSNVSESISIFQQDSSATSSATG